MFRVEVNGENRLEYQPQSRLPGHVRGFLDAMDVDMNSGIELAGERIAQPDDQQRAHFVAVQLLRALETGNKRLQAASCAWLAERQPALRLLQVSETEDEMTLELVLET